MIAPSNRLIAAFALLVLPCALFAGVVPSTAVVCVSAIAVVVAVALVDALISARRDCDLKIEVPEVVRMSKGREARLDVQVSRKDVRVRNLRFGIPFPEALHPEKSTVGFSIAENIPAVRFALVCTPRRRGRYETAQAFIEERSRLGFWEVRHAVPAAVEYRVYPNLRDEGKAVSALFLNRGDTGIHSQRQVGRGRDFERLREYAPGDNYDEIYWKATARRGFPVTKVFQVERTQEVYVLIDTSRLSARAPSLRVLPPDQPPERREDEPVLERFINAALAVGLAAERQGDLFGVGLFSDRVKRFVRAKNGKAHYGICRDAIYTARSEPVTPDFNELFAFIRLRLRRRALLIILTSLDDPVLAEAFQRDAELICRHHLVMVNMVRPAAMAPLFSTGPVQSVDEIYEHLAGHLRWDDIEGLRHALRTRGIHLSVLENERLCADVVSSYMNVKQRQLL